MSIFFRKRALLALTMSLFLLPAVTFAQFNIPQVQDDFSLELTPATPSANSSVSARIVSYAQNLSRANIVWTLNGKEIDSGIGVVTARFTVGGAGSTNLLRVSATSPSGATLSTSANIRPAGLDLLWQSDGYIPPFYKGKAAAPFDASIAVVAMPFFIDGNGNRLSPQSLTYTWHLNGQVVGEASGRGKQSITVPGARVYRGVDLSVDVTSTDGTIAASRSLSFSGDQPVLLMYENDPLLGFRFDRAVPENVKLTRSEVTISAFPYFFSTASRGSGNLTYNWTLNDDAVSPSPKNSADLVLRQTNGTSGKATVGLTIQNIAQIFQTASHALSMTFGN